VKICVLSIGLVMTITAAGQIPPVTLSNSPNPPAVAHYLKERWSSFPAGTSVKVVQENPDGTADIQIGDIKLTVYQSVLTTDANTRPMGRRKLRKWICWNDGVTYYSEMGDMYPSCPRCAALNYDGGGPVGVIEITLPGRKLPWPPPRASARATIPSSVFTTSHDVSFRPTLGEAANRISKALTKCE
jgi:hypothetical protein